MHDIYNDEKVYKNLNGLKQRINQSLFLGDLILRNRKPSISSISI